MTTADVWYVYPDSFRDERLAELRDLLSADERERAERCHFPRDRRCFIVTRASLRSSLSRHAGVDARDWRFSVDALGKPIVDEPRWARALNFNVSHTRGFGVCIVADRPVGIDVENTTRGVPPGLMELCLGPEERADVLAEAVERQAARFFRYWTVKEAYAKARGVGLRLPLSRLRCHFQAERVSVHDAAAGDTACGWAVSSWQATCQHRVSVAVLDVGEPLVLQVRWGLGDAALAFEPRRWASPG